MELVWFRPTGTKKTMLLDKHDAILRIVNDYGIEYYYAKNFLEKTQHSEPLICKSGVYKYTPNWKYLSIDNIIFNNTYFDYIFENGVDFPSTITFRMVD